ncbi:ATP-dependent helicase/nuclease subunit A [Rhizoctonia solani]|uniref:ATP-dependent helicase/nuclease subunit A n=1 Tax=Rhizoctonia solani TaxID=456999 RepID=A0A0K6FQX9_9AGAM|nr:ATP-dependent helicase/nuclease subunit A [Rhizoctonia solani]
MELADVENTIKFASRALALTSDDHPELPYWLARLGGSHAERFRRLGEPNDNEKAIEYISRAFALVPSDHPKLPYWLNSLGVSYNDRFRRLGELGDIDKSIEYMSLALTLTSSGHPHLPYPLHSLGLAHSDRFQRLGKLEDMEKSLEYTSRALSQTPNGHPDLPNRLAGLSISHNNRFHRFGELDDVNKSIEYTSRALVSTLDHHPEMLHQITQLGKFYGDRFQRLGEMEDLEKAIECTSRAIALTPEDHPDLPNELAQLGKSHNYRFHRFGGLEDVVRSIEYTSRALALTPDDHPELPHRLTQLGEFYNDRSQRLGELEDLEKAIEYLARALFMTPDDHPELLYRLTQLGKSYNNRFQRLGELNDLEKAVEYTTRALDLTPNDHPELPHQLTQLGKSYNDRFQQLGGSKDLEKAIECVSRAVSLTPDHHPDLPLRLVQIGKCHNDQFQQLGNIEDLEKATEFITRALALTPDDHPELLLLLAELGKSYSNRFQRFGGFGGFEERVDLERAVECTTQALALTPKDHPELPRQLIQLGDYHRRRFGLLGEPEDIAKAIEYASQALALTPIGHPSLPTQHFHLAKSRRLLYQHTGDPFHAQESLDSFRSASKLPTGGPRDKFMYALHWANLASKHSFLNPIEAYQIAIDLLPQFVWLGAATNQRYKDLSKVERLAAQAASAAIRSSNYRLALEWLEQTRSVVWNQTMMLRSPLDQLQSSHPTLATRLQTVAVQLSQSQESQVLSVDSETPERAAWRHRHLAMEYSDLLNQVRSLPGFSDFRRPMKASSLVRAARNGPIVILICNEDCCDALVILPGKDDIQHLLLPNFAQKSVQHACSSTGASLRRNGLITRGLFRLGTRDESNIGSGLAALWRDIVKPVLDFLGYTDATPMGDLPHVTWCPTGALTSLPLHAAGDYTQPQSRVYDYVISSYTPTLTALLTNTPSTLDHNSRVLAIGQAATPGHQPLPSVTIELAYVKGHIQHRAKYSELTDSQATTTAVLDAMEQHDWVHFTCHCRQNFNDPTKSGFFLHDGVLDLTAINQRSFKNKGLAFLSACQTATGDETLPDEAIHLAAGMLIAGYPSVIATLWSLADEDAPLVADKVYARLMNNGEVGNGQTAEALHYAIAALRDKVGETAFERWVPYIHIGS